MVPTSGSVGERLAPVTASGVTLPSLACTDIIGMASNITSIWPPSRSLSAGAEPRYGTMVMLMPVLVWNSAVASSNELPVPPPMPNLIVPGLLLASAISSPTVLTPRSLRATRISGPVETSVTGVNFRRSIG